MAHPVIHSRSSVKHWGGKEEDYLYLHEWIDATKAWVGHSVHRMFRHHSEGIFEAESIFGKSIINSDDKEVFVRYILERHVKEDCNGRIPSAVEYVNAITSGDIPKWMKSTLNMKAYE